MYIETPRIIIRNFIPEDAAELHEILGDAEVMENCEPAYSFEKTQSFLTSFCIARKGALAAVHRENEKVIGYILLNEFDEGVCEMGWFFNRNFWRQGYALEACRAVIAHAFRERKVHKIFAETIDTVKSARLAEKLGMRLESIQRSQTKDNRGRWADMYFYGLLEEDWKGRGTV